MSRNRQVFLGKTRYNGLDTVIAIGRTYQFTARSNWSIYFRCNERHAAAACSERRVSQDRIKYN